MYAYCDEKKIPYKKVGKLIVATNKVEVDRLADLHSRGTKLVRQSIYFFKLKFQQSKIKYLILS